jgi:hypothetical protein
MPSHRVDIGRISPQSPAIHCSASTLRLIFDRAGSTYEPVWTAVVTESSQACALVDANDRYGKTPLAVASGYRTQGRFRPTCIRQITSSRSAAIQNVSRIGHAILQRG